MAGGVLVGKGFAIGIDRGDMMEWKRGNRMVNIYLTGAQGEELFNADIYPQDAYQLTRLLNSVIRATEVVPIEQINIT